MKILVTGIGGQVGYELMRSLQPLGEVVGVDRAGMDLADLDQVREVIRRERPAIIVNAAAYTAVDKAETERELAMRINAEAPGVMAMEAAALGAAMIHYSTDYVFDGTKNGPYAEDDAPCPINTYGRSKLAGEKAIQASGANHLILRTSWVYGRRGHNFLLTMQRLANERDELRIVSDQHGAPTWCRTIADSTAHAIGQARCAANREEWWRQRTGIYHLTSQGKTSWHGFTAAILEQSNSEKKPRLVPIGSDQYPLPAARPLNSSLSCAKFTDTFCCLPQWHTALQLCLG